MTKAEFDKALNNAIKATKKEKRDAEIESLKVAFNAPRFCTQCVADCTSEIYLPEHKLLDAIFQSSNVQFMF